MFPVALALVVWIIGQIFKSIQVGLYLTDGYGNKMELSRM
jgi:hypothetical protein